MGLKFTKTVAGMVLLASLFVVLASFRFSGVFQRTGISLSYGIFVTFQAFFFMFCGAIFIIRVFWKEHIRDFGWSPPFREKNALILTVAVIVILLPLAFIGSKLLLFQEYYSLGELPFAHFLFFGIVLPAIYYFGEEFLFRGFLFFGLFRKIGYHAFWVSSIIFALFHIGKPWLEIPFAFVVGFVFSYLSLKTKSFIPAAIVHFVIALALNILVTYAWGASQTFPTLHF